MREPPKHCLDHSPRISTRRPGGWLSAVLVFVAGLISGCGTGSHDTDPMIARGRKLYDVSCGSCHRPTGSGAKGIAAPLAGSPWVKESVERLVRISLQGVRGPIEVNGREFNLEMPGFQNVYGDEDLAAILTYARDAWGNEASPIPPERVASIRAFTANRGDSWTAEELMEW
jgi:mono/diheme cytochrome c family protein